ncbi:MAG: T9SS type A sorting domain-containing protein [Prevotellaceae bacterium]|nr:T9SS type A sorting domain-containing protein [Prevotellaceae bacterium]
MTKKLFIGLLLMFCHATASAATPSLIVQDIGGATQSIPLGSIGKLTFASAQVQAHTANDVIPFPINNIGKITFGEMLITNTAAGGAADIALYPNPATDIICIDAPEGSAVTIVDLYGRSVWAKDVSPLQQINVSALPAGVYIIKINTPDNGIITKKIIKQ